METVKKKNYDTSNNVDEALDIKGNWTLRNSGRSWYLSTAFLIGLAIDLNIGCCLKKMEYITKNQILWKREKTGSMDWFY